MILEKLQRLNPSKSPRPDGWHPYFLRELATELSYPVVHIILQVKRELSRVIG